VTGPATAVKILDGHMHLLTAETAREAAAWQPPASPAVAAAAARRLARYEHEQAIPSAAPAPEGVEAAAARWLRELDRHGVSAAVFLALAPRPETLRRFVAIRPDRLLAFTFINPSEPDAPDRLAEDVQQRGFRGLKLYPTIQGFHVCDERAYPLYERAEALGIPILLHFGVTLDYRSDLRYANPLELHPVARDFPGIPFIVAHAGAGFLRETLFLAYHCANVHVDTSGSGTWMAYLPQPMTAREVLERLLAVFGIDRVIFGSDSRHATEGYRHWLLAGQRSILEALQVSEEGQRKVLGGNMARLLKLPW
jgi:predicted TIM-barrel fold metal-dependent hydrolase